MLFFFFYFTFLINRKSRYLKSMRLSLEIGKYTPVRDHSNVYGRTELLDNCHLCGKKCVHQVENKLAVKIKKLVAPFFRSIS